MRKTQGEEKKSERIQIILTKKDKEEIEKKAKESRRTISEYLVIAGLRAKSENIVL